MTLQEKVLRLKLEAVAAVRHALWWEKQIKIHGEEKTTAFYKHLGLNHVEDKVIPGEPNVHIFLHSEPGPGTVLGGAVGKSFVEGKAVAGDSFAKKSFEWDGLTLSREPTEAEKRCVKGIAGAQDTAKEKLSVLLLGVRAQLIKQGLEELQNLTPATYHTLILTPSESSIEILRELLDEIYREGRALVAAELGDGKGFKDVVRVPDELDILADVTAGRVVNDVQARITAAAARFRLNGLEEVDLFEAVEADIQVGSVSYINRAAVGLANRVIGMGRFDEAQRRSSDWERVEYSAILDANTCAPCYAEDGKESEDGSDLEPVPNVNCPGECRCFHVWIMPRG